MSLVSRFFEPRAGERGASSRIYIDLSDVVGHSLWHATGAGIQRVQLEAATALVRSHPNAVPFSLYGGIWRDLRAPIEEAQGDGDKLYARLRAHFPYPGARPSLLKLRHAAQLVKARLRALRDRLVLRPPRLNDGDTLFVGGQFWMSKTVIKLCRRAAAQGANLIVLFHVLFHDLIPLTHPHFTGHNFAGEYREVLRLPAHFIVTTPFNAGELESVRKTLGTSWPASVSIVPLAEEFSGARRNERALPPPKKLPDFAGAPFVLCVGTIEVRKNHSLLLWVWEALAAEFGELLPKLVIAGRRGWKAEATLRKLDDLPSQSRIVFVEAPSDEDLRWLYSACLFSIFPSFFEGWGLPVGESLWFGKACAASNSSLIPTVGRDLCVYFSPQEPGEMKSAIYRLLDPEVHRSFETRIEAAKLRSWAEVASDIERIIAREPATNTPRA
jgi:glycosyltransferase involved in cell wall biosynthesis